MKKNGELCWKMEKLLKKLRGRKIEDRRQKKRETEQKGKKRKEGGKGVKEGGRGGKRDQRGMYRTETMTKDQSDKIGQTDKL